MFEQHEARAVPHVFEAEATRINREFDALDMNHDGVVDRQEYHTAASGVKIVDEPNEASNHEEGASVATNHSPAADAVGLLTEKYGHLTSQKQQPATTSQLLAK